ncbi:hypothetical protein [Rathayibacter festucae]|uniref:hypothetical protein n=1 Tax=Rathayibacter festucae TaxID=110937 RepID=UPI002A6A5DCE|nr:hypothetical protein [Rathayibacter festucae]MDY0914514.1 hypothetical protein [Rathayibacter festucae]
MDEPQQDERAALLRRAYGRNADIGQDPYALTRLLTLQQGAFEAEREAVGPPPAAPTVLSNAARPDVPPAATTSSPATPPRKRRPVALLWASSTAAAAVLTAVAMTVIGAAEDREVATLTLAPSDDIPGWVDGGVPDTAATKDSYGLTIVKQPTSADREDCIWVIPTVTTDNGPVYSGCAAGRFPATAQVPVSAALPAALRKMFPDDTGLRFILDGTHVRVLSDQ